MLTEWSRSEILEKTDTDKKSKVVATRQAALEEEDLEFTYKLIIIYLFIYYLFIKPNVYSKFLFKVSFSLIITNKNKIRIKINKIIKLQIPFITIWFKIVFISASYCYIYEVGEINSSFHINKRKVIIIH